MGTTRPRIQWVLKVIPLRVKRPWREADHSPPSNAEVNNGGTTRPLSTRLHDVVLICLISYGYDQLYF
jgi:hypothetical protein